MPHIVWLYKIIYTFAIYTSFQYTNDIAGGDGGGGSGLSMGQGHPPQELMSI